MTYTFPTALHTSPAAFQTRLGNHVELMGACPEKQIEQFRIAVAQEGLLPRTTDISANSIRNTDMSTNHDNQFFFRLQGTASLHPAGKEHFAQSFSSCESWRVLPVV